MIWETMAIRTTDFAWLTIRWALLAEGWSVIKVADLEGVTYLRRPYRS
jgi:hypothetical protein